ncbi:Non-specific lipid-transfer protein 1 [Frankliniella fusca]|uniref:Non-specific lipid-transfer protein 1 n=1 Tax=Frankliniella fusca TaxID=407009 RepID=A0AAE1GQD4_9NEOP|nr:Non-specific lipid-transfer protein 1 [Frankliniella fusca]
MNGINWKSTANAVSCGTIVNATIKCNMYCLKWKQQVFPKTIGGIRLSDAETKPLDFNVLVACLLLYSSKVN